MLPDYYQTTTRPDYHQTTTRLLPNYHQTATRLLPDYYMTILLFSQGTLRRCLRAGRLARGLLQHSASQRRRLRPRLLRTPLARQVASQRSIARVCRRRHRRLLRRRGVGADGPTSRGKRLAGAVTRARPSPLSLCMATTSTRVPSDMYGLGCQHPSYRRLHRSYGHAIQEQLQIARYPPLPF